MAKDGNVGGNLSIFDATLLTGEYLAQKCSQSISVDPCEGFLRELVILVSNRGNSSTLFGEII